MRKLTDSELNTLALGRTELFNNLDKTESNYTLLLLNTTYRNAFAAGLSYNQAKLDKLIAFIKGEITRSEIEEIING